jgi:hypothetical protein
MTKKTTVILLGTLMLAAMTLALIPTTRDGIHWLWASHLDDAGSYESYLRAWPDGRHAIDAKKRFDECSWANALGANKVQMFDLYLQSHPEGTHAKEAKDRIESLHWQEATQAQSVQGFEQYLRLYSEGTYAKEAKDRIESLRWQEATQTRSVQGFERYLTFYPEGLHAAEARDMIESLHWQEAMETQSVQGFERYLRQHADGKNATEARSKAEELTWAAACAPNTIRALRIYSSAYPKGRFTEEALKRQAAMSKDEKLFAEAIKKGTPSAVKAFLWDYPGHRREADARKVLKRIAKAVVVVEYPKEVEATTSPYSNVESPFWPLKVLFKETGGETGYKLTAGNDYYYARGRTYYGSGGASVKVAPGGTTEWKTWWSSGSHNLCNGRREQVWKGEDDLGNPIQVKITVRGIHSNCPKK